MSVLAHGVKTARAVTGVQLVISHRDNDMMELKAVSQESHL